MIYYLYDETKNLVKLCTESEHYDRKCILYDNINHLDLAYFLVIKHEAVLKNSLTYLRSLGLTNLSRFTSGMAVLLQLF